MSKRHYYDVMNKEPAEPGEARLTLRLPADLALRTGSLAKRDHRSLNGELIWLIERGLAAEEASALGAQALKASLARHPSTGRYGSPDERSEFR
jgi:hypothetical protein